LDGGSAVITQVTTAGRTISRGHTIDTDAVLPCGPDPELWFADTPADVEPAKSPHTSGLAAVPAKPRRRHDTPSARTIR
jgi:hypothetical protein